MMGSKKMSYTNYECCVAMLSMTKTLAPEIRRHRFKNIPFIFSSQMNGLSNRLSYIPEMAKSIIWALVRALSR